jgi:hypothetical protein
MLEKPIIRIGNFAIFMIVWGVTWIAGEIASVFKYRYKCKYGVVEETPITEDVTPIGDPES